MLNIERTRQTIASFYVEEDGQKHLVKTTIVNTDGNAVSTSSENIIDAERYAANRRDMRKDELALQNTIYEIEDAVLNEIEAAKAAQAQA